jgi:hypothetical protein
LCGDVSVSGLLGASCCPRVAPQTFRRWRLGCPQSPGLHTLIGASRSAGGVWHRHRSRSLARLQPKLRRPSSRALVSAASPEAVEASRQKDRLWVPTSRLIVRACYRVLPGRWVLMGRAGARTHRQTNGSRCGYGPYRGADLAGRSGSVDSDTGECQVCLVIHKPGGGLLKTRLCDFAAGRFNAARRDERLGGQQPRLAVLTTLLHHAF